MALNETLVTSSARNNYNYIRDKGILYPVIRIKDYIIPSERIIMFEIDNFDFLPIITLELNMHNNNLLKNDVIAEGDKISFAILSGNDMIKTLRCDFIINSYVFETLFLDTTDDTKHIIIYGELYIPKLYDNSFTNTSFNGTSRDALIYMTKLLGLSFFFNDTENTNDSQVWYCMKNENESVISESSIAINFLKYVTKCSYKDFDSFYTSWIDPRYGFTFLNVNKILGIDGFDGDVDITPIISAISNISGSDPVMTNSAEYNKLNAIPGIKMITNLKSDTHSFTNFYATSFRIINNSGSIDDSTGINKYKNFQLSNANNNSALEFDFKYAISYNKTKIDSKKFYLLVGPGNNTASTTADNGSYPDLQENIARGGSEIIVKGDEEVAKSNDGTESNDTYSGNTNKNILAGEEHNKLNNALLDKMWVEVVLLGANLQIMRGEKIPVILADFEQFSRMLSQHTSSSNLLGSYIYEIYSGWFMIGGIKWKWERDSKKNNNLSNWTTTLKLQRREWPIPGANKTNNTINNTIDVNNTLTSSNNSNSSNSSDTSNTNNSSDSTSNTTNLTNLDYINKVNNIYKSFYNSLYDELKNNNKEKDLKILYGKLYRINKNKEKVSSSSLLLKLNGLYVYKDDAEKLYTTTETCDHELGNAFNFIVSGMNAANIIKIILNSKVLINYNVSISVLDSNTIHVGTINKDTWDNIKYNYLKNNKS